MVEPGLKRVPIERLWLFCFRGFCGILFVLSLLGLVAGVASVAYSVAEFKSSGWFGVALTLFCLICTALLARVGWIGLKIKSRADLESQGPPFARLRQSIERWANK